MQRICPGPAVELSVEEAYAAPLGTPDDVDADRPWVGLCMVASIDGSTVVDGDSAALSSTTDSAVLARLRALADVIIVGAGTVRGEGYGPPKKVGQRIGVVTGTGAVDTTTPLFTTGAGFVITTDTTEIPDGVDVVRAGKVYVDLGRALELLGPVAGDVRFVQAEGGPELNGALLDADLIDELNATTSARSVGGSGPRLTTGAENHDRRYALAQLAVDDDSYLYARWRRQR